MQPTTGDRRCEVTRHSRSRLRGARVGEASNPGPQPARIVSEDEPILPGRFSPRRHGDSAESVLIPGSPLDGFESVAPQRSRRRGGLPNAPLKAVHPIQVASACRNQCRGRQPVIDKAFEATGTSGFPIRSDDESRHLLSARRTPVTQPASVGPTWAESLSIHDGPVVFPMTDVSEREEAHRRPTRRVVLLPQPTGTPRSIQDQSHSGCEDEAREGREAVQMTTQFVLQLDLEGVGIAEVAQETAASQRSTPVVPTAV